MVVSQDELMYLQSQLEGLESIFLELMPFSVELKRQQVQDFYDKRFSSAMSSQIAVAENELRRQFNTKANQVRNLVDSAESLGDAVNKINLIRAAACLPADRNRPLKSKVLEFCKSIILENRVDPSVLVQINKSKELGPLEARVMLGSIMFLIADQVDHGGEALPIKDLLAQIIGLIKTADLLPRNDPFFNEAMCALEGMEEDPD